MPKSFARKSPSSSISADEGRLHVLDLGEDSQLRRGETPMSTTQIAGGGNGDREQAPAVATSQDELRDLLHVFLAVRDGDFSVRLPGHWSGLVGKIADAVNDVVAANAKMAEQLERVGQVVGKE